MYNEARHSPGCTHTSQAVAFNPIYFDYLSEKSYSIERGIERGGQHAGEVSAAEKLV